MFLSRLTFNTRCRLARRHLAQPYELHRTLLSAFPDGGVHLPRASAEAHGVLYRVEPHPALRKPSVLLQSTTEPDWSGLQALHDESGAAFLHQPPQCGSVSSELEPGGRYAFRLRANPTKRDATTRKRVGLYHEEDQLRWLHRKLVSADYADASDQAAVRIMQVVISKEGNNSDRSRESGNRGSMTHLSVQFDGVLEVLDPAQVATLLRSGVGSGKGFGFGLLSLKRVG
jgi:CRISPR system Cascade subunit CasE